MARLEVEIVGDARQLRRALRDVEKDSKSFGKSLRGMGRTAALTAGAAGVGGLVLGLKAGIKEFKQAQQVTAQTNAVLKSTGGVANVSAKEVTGLATALMKKSGVDDEVIQSGENVLLTFTKIRNETGKGNDVFNQATAASLNLSVALGKDLQSSAILVGKALNDPVKGMGALSRAGIQFTKEQKETIKTLVESGKTMDAQKLILKELETQFGGSAEAAGKTMGGQVNLLKENVNNLLGSLVAGLMPALLTLTKHLMTGAKWLQENQRAAKVLVGVVAGLTTALVAAKVAQAALNLSVLANPYVAAAALLAAYVVVLIRFRNFSREAQAAIVAFTAVFSPLGAALLLVRTQGDKALNMLDAFKTRGGEMLAPVISAFRTLGRAVSSIVRAIQWLIDHIPDIPSPPKVPGWLDPRNIGDGAGPRGGSAGLDGASSVMQPFANRAASFGLSVTSGLRPGARTKHGTLSDHALGKALDVADGPAGMAMFFRSLIGNPRVKQAFYDPLGSIFGGAPSSYREGGHSNHVHVATYAKGGVVTSPTLGLVGEAGPEAIVPLGRNWKNNFQAFLANAWKVAGPFLGGGKMPFARFMSQQHSRGRSWTNVWAGDVALPVNERSVAFSEQVWRGINAAAGSWGHQQGLNTVLHEWAHARQKAGVLGSQATAEGGATAFVRLLGERIWRKLGISYKGYSMGNPYEQWATQMIKNRGASWVRKGQFDSFAQGGIVPGSGPQPAIVHGGETILPRGNGGTFQVNLNLDGSLLAKVLVDPLRREAKVFQRQNGKAAFG